MSHRDSSRAEARLRTTQRLIPWLVLVSAVLGCGEPEPTSPTAPTFGSVQQARAARVVVTSLLDDGDGTCGAAKCTLRDAIATAPPGADVTFGDKLCPRRATPATGCRILLAGGQLGVGKSLQIVGPSGYSLAVDGALTAAAVLAIGPGASVAASRLTITGGSTNGILNGGILSLDGVTVSGNGTLASLGNGGGIDNGINSGTGIAVTLTNSTVSGNLAVSGGGIYNPIGGTVTLTGSTVSGNTGGSGAGVFNNGGTLVLTHSRVTKNSALGSGGGIFNWSNGVTTLTTSTVSDNSAASDGGGIWTEGGSVTLSGTSVARNSSGTRGGGIFANGPVALTKKSCVNNNSASSINSSEPWNPVNIFLFAFGTVTGLNCGVAQP